MMAWAVALASGCGHGAGTGYATSAELPEERRRPDGVALDPASEPPPAVGRAEVGEGLVTLQAPLGVNVAVSTVADFFRRVVQEDSDGLSAMLTRDALVVVPSTINQGGQTPALGPLWEQRFRRLDYGKLAGETIYRASEVEIYRAEDAIEVPPHPGIQTQTLDDDDVLVRVPIITARVGAERLLGDELLFWLRRDGTRFRVYRVLEDFQLQ
ncbi:hypothetical protein [Chondromyces apiculatus]|nr:hypothetical protein [Chondromyces apiculatus]